MGQKTTTQYPNLKLGLRQQPRQRMIPIDITPNSKRGPFQKIVHCRPQTKSDTIGKHVRVGMRNKPFGGL